jgi:hypothetical protein
VRTHGYQLVDCINSVNFPTCQDSGIHCQVSHSPRDMAVAQGPMSTHLMDKPSANSTM